MKKVLIFSCKRIRDHSCVACAKCSKAAMRKEGEFAGEQDIFIVGNTECGDCPGLIMPRVGLVMTMLQVLDQKPDAVHLATCMKVATETGQCQMDLEKVAGVIQEKTGIPVVIGTHPYL